MIPPVIYSSDKCKSYAETLATSIGTTSSDEKEMIQHCHLYLSETDLSFFHPEARSTKKFKIDFNSVLVNYYRDGKDSMGWHSDDEKELGPNPTIASISFGSERDLVFRNKISKETRSIAQAHGCLILIDGKTQKNWQHSIKKTQKAIGPRINLTFRNIIDKNNF